MLANDIAYANFSFPIKTELAWLEEPRMNFLENSTKIMVAFLVIYINIKSWNLALFLPFTDHCPSWEKKAAYGLSSTGMGLGERP